MIERVLPVRVDSPCVGVCVIDDESGWCVGCARTLDEIAGWLALGPKGRAAVMAALPARLSRLAPSPPPR